MENVYTKNGYKNRRDYLENLAIDFDIDKGKEFILNTTATMKDYNSEKWGIERNIVKSMQVEAKDLREALDKYRETIAEKYCIDISNNAIKNKNAMYIDLANGEFKQIGYVITGKTDFQDDTGKWTSQYIDLWIEIISVIDTIFS